MTEPIRIDPQVLREVADGHEEVARMVADARDRSTDILAAVASYGPIMHEFKAAVADLLIERDAALSDHIAGHLRASDELHRAANLYTAVDDANAEQIQQLPQ
jgi:hypothetical protein